jgi:branched-chain amino acid transport system substrate-binding protein
MMKTARALALTAAVLMGLAPAAQAQKKYGPGVTDTEIKLGQTMPYSGPASAYGTQGRALVAYFKMINAQGGINGRKVTVSSLDDGYSPPKTVEMTRKLVEEEEVLALVNSIGTPTNTAVHKYLNVKKVPHLLVSSGADKWNDPKNFPWTTPGFQSYTAEARVYAAHLLKTNPNAKIAILQQNDDFGRDFARGFKEGLGANAKLIVHEATYEVTDPTVDSQMVALKSSGADTLFIITTPKFGAQAIRKAAELGWKPSTYIASVSSAQSQVLAPAGLENSVGLITATVIKEPSDPTWEKDPGMIDYKKFMAEWYKDGDPMNTGNVVGYIAAQIMHQVLKNCGDDLTRENVLKQATNIRDLPLPMLLPGISYTISPTAYTVYKKFRTARFDGKRWVLFGDPISVD